MKNNEFRKKMNFTQVTNFCARNKELSLKSKGLYLTIQSYITLENFELRKSHLMSMSTDKTKSFDSAWKELKEKGFLKQYRYPNINKKGTFSYVYDLLDKPDLTTPEIVNITKDELELFTDIMNDESRSINEILLRRELHEQKQQEIEDKKEIEESKSTEIKNNTKEKDIYDKIEKFASECGIILYRPHLDKILELCNNFELIQESLILSIDATQNKFGFILGILRNWKNLNIQTKEQLDSFNNKISNNSCKNSDINDSHKTKFHNFTETFTQYAPDELERIISLSQKEKFN